MKIERGELQVFFDELWAEHLQFSTGVVHKVFKYPHNIGKAPYELGFIKQKPSEFYKIDGIARNFIQDISWASFIDRFIKYADNRMIQGDYRYGFISSQNLNEYNLVTEFYRRLYLAEESENLEYVVDSYNMIRLQYFKSKDLNQFWDLFLGDLFPTIQNSYEKNWKLISIDDGQHAEKYV